MHSSILVARKEIVSVGVSGMPVVLYAIASEKAVSAIERSNSLTLVVARSSTKPEVRKEVEKQFNEKVKSVTTAITPDGRKKAFVRFSKQGAAADVAAKLKIL